MTLSTSSAAPTTGKSAGTALTKRQSPLRLCRFQRQTFSTHLRHTHEPQSNFADSMTTNPTDTNAQPKYSILWNHLWIALFLFGAPIGLRLSSETSQAATSEQVQPTQPMAVARQGHTATVLADGRVLIIGGRNADGVLASAEIFDANTRTFQPAGNLIVGRVGHAATLLPNGRVLITGGQNTAGPLSTAEMFDFAETTGFRPVLSTMGAARLQHTATLLANGKVLIAGGDAAGTAELFDPTYELFSSTLLQLAEPRAGHSATLFSDNNVFLAGGGTRSAEFFRTADNTFVLWPQSLNEIRVGHAAIPTLDARLLLFGGDAANTVEEFDPASGFTPKVALAAPNSTATLLANGMILITWPNTAGIYAPANSAFEMLTDARLHRRGNTATELPMDKKVLVAGGLNGSDELVNVAALFNPVRITTDLDDYPPFSSVLITGTGFLPSEAVNNQVVQVEGPDAGTAYDAWAVVADTNGGFTTSWFVFTEDLLNTKLELTAIGQISGLKAQATFTDAKLWSAHIAPTSANSGVAVTYTLTVTNQSTGA